MNGRQEGISNKFISDIKIMPSTSSSRKSRRSSSLASPSLFKHRRDSRVEQKLKNKSHQNNSAVDLLAIRNDATAQSKQLKPIVYI